MNNRGGGSYEKLYVHALVREKFSTIFKQFQDHCQPNIGSAAAHPAHPVPPPLKKDNLVSAKILAILFPDEV